MIQRDRSETLHTLHRQHLATIHTRVCHTAVVVLNSYYAPWYTTVPHCTFCAMPALQQLGYALCCASASVSAAINWGGWGQRLSALGPNSMAIAQADMQHTRLRTESPTGAVRRASEPSPPREARRAAVVYEEKHCRLGTRLQELQTCSIIKKGEQPNTRGLYYNSSNEPAVYCMNTALFP